MSRTPLIDNEITDSQQDGQTERNSRLLRDPTQASEDKNFHLKPEETVLFTKEEDNEPNGNVKGYYYSSTADTSSNDKEEIILEYDASSAQPPERDLSDTKTLMTLFKIFTGPSALALPAAFRNGGLLFGPVGFVVIAYLNLSCNLTMVKCSRILCRKLGKSSLTYEDVMEQSLLLYSQKEVYRIAAKVLRSIAVMMLILTQFGILSFYFQIIGTTLRKEIEDNFPGYNPPLILMEFFVCVCIIPYSLLRNLKIISWFAMAANFIILVCILTILQAAISNLQPASSLPLISNDFWTIPLFVGASVYTVEGIPMILPIENRVKNVENFDRCCGIVTMATTLCISVNMAVGFYGYLAYGDDVPGNILVALPDEWYYEAVSLLFAVMVFLTFTLQLYQPAEAISSWLKRKVKAKWVDKWGNAVVRISSTIVTFLFAALIPKIELLISLVGSFTTVTLVFIFPPLAEIFILRHQPGGIPWYILTKDVILFLFGVVAFFTGTYTSVKDIILAF